MDSKTTYNCDDKMVSHPDHYKLIPEKDVEVLDVVKAVTKDMKGAYAVDTGNALKYICRWDKKNGVQDVKKAIFYLTDLVNELEEKDG